MKRYIDADKFIEYLGFKNTEEERDENIGEVVTLQDFDNQIADDVQEIKHGKWVSTGNALGYTEYHCSECDNYLFLDSKDDELYNYCPYCGAKMDKEEYQE